MLRYLKPQDNWYLVGAISFFIAMLGGVLLRFQYAGLFHAIGDLDIRRSHSHLGFYGFLFPMLWSQIKSSGVWVPSGHLKCFYTLLLIVSTVSFSISGYNLVSHITSFLILLFWIYFAVKMLKTSKGIIYSIPISIFFSVLVIASIMISIFFMKNEAPRFELARIFLTALLFGVFGSYIMSKIQVRKTHPSLWLIGALGSGVSLSNLVYSKWILIFPALWSAVILYSVIKSKYDLRNKYERLRIYYMIFAISLLLLASGLVQINSLIAVAGIHYFVFVCCALFFFEFRSQIKMILFEAASLLMSLLILMLAVGSLGAYIPKLIAMASAMVLVTAALAIKFEKK